MGTGFSAGFSNIIDNRDEKGPHYESATWGLRELLQDCGRKLTLSIVVIVSSQLMNVTSFSMLVPPPHRSLGAAAKFAASNSTFLIHSIPMIVLT